MPEVDGMSAIMSEAGEHGDVDVAIFMNEAVMEHVRKEAQERASGPSRHQAEIRSNIPLDLSSSQYLIWGQCRVRHGQKGTQSSYDSKKF